MQLIWFSFQTNFYDWLKLKMLFEDNLSKTRIFEYYTVVQVKIEMYSYVPEKELSNATGRCSKQIA